MMALKTLRCFPPVDFNVPFGQLRPQDITIYFHAANTVGKKTCQAACEHCYFFNEAPYEVPRKEAMQIVHSLHRQGYDISYILADSFADEALLADEGGSAFRVEENGFAAWSAGRILTQPGWEDRLDRGWQLGYRAITITAHDAADTPIVFRGVTPGRVIRTAVENICAWRARTGHQLQIILTFTFHKRNLTRENLQKMAEFCLNNGVDVCRFNALANFRRDPKLTSYELERDDIVRFYGYLAELCASFQHTPLYFGMSEDVGDAGIEQVLPWLSPEWHVPNRTQWCRAGFRLFALIKVGEELRIVGCVDRWDPPLGRVIKVGNDYHIEWDFEKIEEFRLAVLREQVYACWGGIGCDGDERGFVVDRDVQAKILTR